MVKRKRKGGRRRRAKPGLLALASYAAAIAEVSNGAYFKNPITDAIRQAVPSMVGGTVGKAAVIVVGGTLIHTETNKAGLNPAIGPVRLL